MAKLKTIAEMDRERMKQIVIDDEIRKNRKPEPNISTPLAYFEVSRYTSGNFKGMFVISQMITEDHKGRELRKPIKKTVIDGVFIDGALDALGQAIRKRVFR